jgi:hypothetical protein
MRQGVTLLNTSFCAMGWAGTEDDAPRLIASQPKPRVLRTFVDIGHLPDGIALQANL